MVDMYFYKGGTLPFGAIAVFNYPGERRLYGIDSNLRLETESIIDSVKILHGVVSASSGSYHTKIRLERRGLFSTTTTTRPKGVFIRVDGPELWEELHPQIIKIIEQAMGWETSIIKFDPDKMYNK